MPAKRARRTTYHHGALDRALLAAAIALLAENDVEGVTLREVARRVGVSHAAAYRHFEDKPALLAAVAREGWEELGKQMASVVTAKGAADKRTSAERFLELGAAYVTYALEHPAHYRVMTGARLNESGRFPELDAAMAVVVRLVETEVKGAMKEGALPEARPIDHAMRLWALAHGYVSLVSLGRIQVKPEKAVSYFGALLRPMLEG